MNPLMEFVWHPVIDIPTVVTSMCVTLAAYLIGMIVGRGQSAQRQVDRLLRRETRFRHPAGSQRSATRLDLSVDTSALERTLDAVSDDCGRHAATVGWTGKTLKFDPDRPVCGKIAKTSLGNVQCLRAPGHAGGCA